MAWLAALHGLREQQLRRVVLQQICRGAHSLARRKRDWELRQRLEAIKLQRRLERRKPDRIGVRAHKWSDEDLHWRFETRNRYFKETQVVGDSLLHGWARGIPPQRSLAWFESQNRRLHTVTVVDVLRRCRTPYVAWEFFEWARQRHGFQHTSVTGAMLLRAYCLSGRHDAAVKMFRREMQRVPDRWGGAPTELMYNILIQGLCNAGKMDQAVELYNEMTGEHGFPYPGPDTNAILGKGFCRNGLVSEALRFLEGFRDTNNRFLAPSLPTYNVVLEALCKNKKIGDACSLFRQAGIRPDEMSYTILITGLCENARAVEAKGLLWDMVRARLDGDAEVFNVVAVALCNEDRDDDALAVLEGMVARRHQPDETTIKALTDKLWKTGRMDRKEATAVIDKICQPLSASMERRMSSVSLQDMPRMGIQWKSLQDMPRMGIQWK